MIDIRTTEIEDPAYWYGSKLAASKDWRRPLTDEEAGELLSAVSANRGRDTMKVSIADFPLPRLSPVLKGLAAHVDRGLGGSRLANRFSLCCRTARAGAVGGHPLVPAAAALQVQGRVRVRGEGDESRGLGRVLPQSDERLRRTHRVSVSTPAFFASA